MNEQGNHLPTVKLHTLDAVKLVNKGLAILDGDNTVLGHLLQPVNCLLPHRNTAIASGTARNYLLHGLGQQVSNLGLAISGDGSDLGDPLGSLNLQQSTTESV